MGKIGANGLETFFQEMTERRLWNRQPRLAKHCCKIGAASPRRGGSLKDWMHAMNARYSEASPFMLLDAAA